jgi:hypothetical protein
MGFFALFLLIPLAMALRAFWAGGEAPQVSQSPHWESRPGIWFCTHRAKRAYKYQHLFIRLTPKDPIWAQRFPELFVQKDREGRPFTTLGAGPKEGKLYLEYNRGYDLNDPVSFEAEAPSQDLAEENRRIEILFVTAKKYPQDLRFSTLGPWTGPGYNCNAMIASLAREAEIPLPAFVYRFMLCAGVIRKVPKTRLGGTKANA